MRALARIAVVIIIVLSVSILYSGCYYGAKPFIDIVDEACASYSIEPELVLAVMKAESDFDTDAVSEAGAVGIMQILPSTAEWICNIRGIEYNESELYDAEFNISLGVWYLEYLSYFEDRNWQLAAYNAGEGTVRGWIEQGFSIKNIPYSETKGYVDKVNKYYKLFKKRNFFN